MEENNIHTSVVIELANQGEPEEQKSYQIDIDDMNLPKDYVIDQIFCGENVTVYALFEVPEIENKNLEKNLIEVSNSNIDDGNRFYYKNSFKKVKSEKKSNSYKQNLSEISSNETLKFISNTNNRNGSFYCLKHPSRNYDLLAPQEKKSDLKILYSKNFSLENSKSTKFKAISVGVNTDIVQSPRIIEEVQKVLGVNVPLLKPKEKTLEAVKVPSSMPSYDMTDVETRPSFSSFASSMGSKNCVKKSVSNFFFVPLLIMEDEILSTFSKENNTQKNLEEEKLLNSETLVSKVSLGVNTDVDEFSSNADLKGKRQQDVQDISNAESSKSVYQNSTDDNLIEQLKVNEKRTILKEIKTMQLKLNTLIKTIESNHFDFDAKDDVLTESESKTNDEILHNLENKEKFLESKESLEKNPKTLDDRPIFLPWSYGLGVNKSKTTLINKTQDASGVEKTEVPTNESEFVSFSVACDEGSSVTKTKKNEADSKLKSFVSNSSVSWKNLENSKSFRLSKSETNLFYNIKYNNGVNKSLSLDLRNFKTEVFKNIKNSSFKLEGCLTTNVKVQVLQNNEVYSGDNEPLLKCETGNALEGSTNKKLGSKVNLLNSPQENEKGENPNPNGKIGSDVEKNCKEEGDAKLVKPTGNMLTTAFTKIAEKQHVAYIDASVTASDGLLNPKKSLCACKKESASLNKIPESENKICSDSEKPPTPNGNCRKIITTNSNMKKDIKGIKKTNNRLKISEMPIKIEAPPKRIITGSRKSARNNAESKLHIDKLIKVDALSNHKIPQLLKYNYDEKSGTKGDWTHRPPLQKYEIKENTAEFTATVNKEIENKLLNKKSPLSLLSDASFKKNIGCSSKANIESAASSENTENPITHLNSQKHIPVLSNPSPVVAELLSKKPKSIKDLEKYSEINHERMNSRKIPNETNGTGNVDAVEKNKAETEFNENLGSMEKSIVKSVWALTKVLLYEDGTKKLEVLEASLTPPGYSLNELVKTSK